MAIATLVLAVIIGLLSIAAGAAKIALVPAEVEFLQQFGFTDLLVICFGAVQVIGGLLIFVPASRLYGAIVVALGFLLSVALILSTGNFAFAAASLVPVALAVFIAYRSMALRRLSSEPQADVHGI